MALKLASTHPEMVAKLQSSLEKLGWNWAPLEAWAIKWGEGLFLVVAFDLLTGNIAGAIAAATAQGPQCAQELIAAIMASLGVNLTPVPTP